jgi:hypothetical protein
LRLDCGGNGLIDHADLTGGDLCDGFAGRGIRYLLALRGVAPHAIHKSPALQQVGSREPLQRFRGYALHQDPPEPVIDLRWKLSRAAQRFAV